MSTPSIKTKPNFKSDQNEDGIEEIAEVEINPDDPDQAPIYNIVLNLNSEDLSKNATLKEPPLFLRKLWKIVNDEKNTNIISWNENGDQFIIHDQLKFIGETLPRYFKHNQLSSFIRQLNLYDFHKIQPLMNTDMTFSHPFFLRGYPQLLPLIKRKSQTGRQKPNISSNEAPATGVQPSSEIQQLMSALNEIKSNEEEMMKKLGQMRQENAALWNEVSSLRLKYSNQSKVINKLIQFVVAYMQKHKGSRKTGRTVSSTNSNKYLKTGPKIMELDYKYKNNPSKFWTDYDNNRVEPVTQNEQLAYTVQEPSDLPMEDESQNVSSQLSGQEEHSACDSSQSEFSVNSSQPSPGSSTNSSALSRPTQKTENMSYLIDNSYVELNQLKDLFKNLSPDEMSTFYKLVNDNYKNQEEDLKEEELMSLSQLSPFNNFLKNSDNNPGSSELMSDFTDTSPSPTFLDNILQDENNMDSFNDTRMAHDTLDVPSLLTNDDLLNSDGLLNNISDDQYLGMG